MNLHILDQPPAQWLGEALEQFEREFLYPLGASDRFSISHGRAYLPFFRAIGDPCVLIAERSGQVLGSLAIVRRMLKLRLHDAEPHAVLAQSVHYLCDLKVRPSARGSFVLARLIAEAKQQIERFDSHACYSIIMDGTTRLPTAYTGRLGVPKFEEIGKIIILRISARNDSKISTTSLAGIHDVESVHAAISPTGYVATNERDGGRSLMSPIPCVEPEGRACGVIEDTRKGKRLFLNGREEMISAHLSQFAYRTCSHGAQLLRRAAAICAEHGLPALFVSVPASEAPQIISALSDLDILQAPASIYGHDLRSGMNWWVDTAEI